MTTSERDRTLMLFLPALAIAAVYILFFARGKTAAVKKAHDSMRSAQAQVPSEDQLAAESARHGDLRETIADHKGDILKARQRLQAAGCFVEEAQRNGRHERLTGLLGRLGLRVVED